MDNNKTLKNCVPEINLLESELVELQRVLMEAREIDRVKLGQILHDGPVQELYGLLFSLKAISDELSPTIRASIDELQSGLQNVVRELMDVCGELRPPTLRPFGLAKTIRSHAETFQSLHPELHIGVELTPDKDLPENIRIALFRIYQEALMNVLQHAHATHVMVRFGINAEEVFLEIQDDGEGFQLPEDWIQMVHQGCLGIADSMERAFSNEGAFHVNSAPGSGTTVRVEIPRAQFQTGENYKVQPTKVFSANKML
ncbi:MAG: hypothetical protein P8Z00_15705 [Anaerolineales bacterium]